MKKNDWYEVVKLTTFPNNSNGYVLYNGVTFNFQYIGDPQKFIGYLQVWSPITKQAIHVSKVQIPQGVNFINLLKQRRLNCLKD